MLLCIQLTRLLVTVCPCRTAAQHLPSWVQLGSFFVLACRCFMVLESWRARSRRVGSMYDFRCSRPGSTQSLRSDIPASSRCHDDRLEPVSVSFGAAIADVRPGFWPPAGMSRMRTFLLARTWCAAGSLKLTDGIPGPGWVLEREHAAPIGQWYLPGLEREGFATSRAHRVMAGTTFGPLFKLHSVGPARIREIQLNTNSVSKS